MADRDIPHRGVPVIDRRASRQTLDETLPEPPAPDDTFDLIPPGVDRVLTKGGLLAQYTSGGMWTVTMPGGRRVQRGHGEFVHNEGPFRVPPELVPEQDDSPE
jgi:hypothetical protein